MSAQIAVCLELCIVLLLLVGMIAAAVRIFKARRKQKRTGHLVALLAAEGILLTAAVIFICSHKTYYRYNDWAILNHNIHMVQQHYGEFDLGYADPTKNIAGTVAYYIYTDNGSFLPDHLKHYYYISYDEWGVVDAVWDGCQPGG